MNVNATIGIFDYLIENPWRNTRTLDTRFGYSYAWKKYPHKSSKSSASDEFSIRERFLLSPPCYRVMHFLSVIGKCLGSGSNDSFNRY